MARIDVLKEEIAEAREKRRNIYIGILFGVLIYFIVAFVSPILGDVKETIWLTIFFLIVLMFGASYLADTNNRVKRLMKELEKISR